MKVIEMMTRRMRRWRSILKVMKEEVEEYPEGGEDPLPADLAVSPPLPRPEQERQPCNIWRISTDNYDQPSVFWKVQHTASLKNQDKNIVKVCRKMSQVVG